MNFKNVDKKYRPIPFWSWNEKLTPEESERQINMMADAGMGGYFMHARGGLQTKFMGEEWFENVSLSIKKAHESGMSVWAYDENGWPSGFGNGMVNGLGIEFQQKYLRMEDGEKQTKNTICNQNGKHFYYEINPFYVDVLNPKITKKFLEVIYQPYYDKYGTEFSGFFTDEPQVSRNGIPWSFTLPEEYRRAYNEDLLDNLHELFEEIGNYKKTRFQFWKLVTDMFSQNFFRQIFEWCEEHQLQLTGHCVQEEGLIGQIASNGAVMPHYEYFHIPGMDWLGRKMGGQLTPLQVSSVAAQLGKKQVLSETFAMCGHNIGFEELKGMLEWQMVHGVTLLCQHLEGYSLRGIRKRDYPPAMYYQQPWWKDYHIFNESMARVGMILTEGKEEYDTLLIHPESTAWIYFNPYNNSAIDKLYSELMQIVQKMEQNHILFHLGDETIIQRHAKVENGCLVIGQQRYKTVVLPPHEILFESTKLLLKEFRSEGGTVINALEELPVNPIFDNPNIIHTKRSFDGYNVYFLVNNTPDEQKTTISVGSKKIDIVSGEILPFNGEHTFGAWGSLMLVDDGMPQAVKLKKEHLTTLNLQGDWKIDKMTENTLTLDFCDYWFDGELEEKHGYVLNIQNRACALERPVRIKCEYSIKAEYLPDSLFLVCETPNIYEILVNGHAIDTLDCGYFADSAFRKLQIAPQLQLGKNKITLTVDFCQSAKVYEQLKKAQIFESEKNKLTYDMEIEPIYLAGMFGVKTSGQFEDLPRHAVRYRGDFVITEPPKQLKLANIQQQGFPFFAGEVCVSKEIELLETNYCLKFQKEGVNVLRVSINNDEETCIMWEPYELDLKKRLKIGKNKITLTLVNTLRNLLGPHHLKEGESYSVGPFSFYKEPCVWNTMPEKDWDDDYCFARFGILSE